ncbi:MAG: protein kinase, partial [Myxococcota bacterium]|nr:protein kinase [Myxococcota bacterium]
MLRPRFAELAQRLGLTEAQALEIQLLFDNPEPSGATGEVPPQDPTVLIHRGDTSESSDASRSTSPPVSAPPGSPAPSLEALGGAAAIPTVASPEDKYVDLGTIGTGGMGEVRRVRDRTLKRVMAMKVIRPALLHRPEVLARFIEEAQATAQLQHPGILPVHELGQLADGRIFFTMKEIKGRTLGQVLQDVHAASAADRWMPGPGGWTFRRMVDAFHKVCEAVAYAHERGVVHRDLKPDNVMLGDHGEVMVVDWGLAKVRGRPDRVAEAGELDPVVTDRSQDASKATRMGAVAGTPAYMPPEQAQGAIDQIDARSDVYALGAILYELLSGRAPYAGASWREVL